MPILNQEISQEIQDLLNIPILTYKEQDGLIILETAVYLPDGDNLVIVYDPSKKVFGDCGETLDKMAVSGIALDSDKNEVLQSLLKHYNVYEQNGELWSSSAIALIQVITHIYDLSWLKQ